MTRGELFRKYSVPEDRISRMDNPYPGYAGNFLVHLRRKEGRVTGTVVTLFHENELPFRGLDDLVLILDRACREIGYPAAETEKTAGSGGKKKEYTGRMALRPELEEKDIRVYDGDVMLRISYRENSSLQGSLMLIEDVGVQPVRFRSALELMRILYRISGDLEESHKGRGLQSGENSGVSVFRHMAEEDSEELQTASDNTIFIYLMNSVRVYWKGQPVRLARRETTRTAQLTAIMALHPDGISKDALMDYFYGTEVLSSRNNSLNTLVYRLRKKMAENGFPDIMYIENRNGMLIWNKELPLMSDVTVFYGAVQRAESAKGTKEEEQLLKEAFNLFQGEIIPQLGNESWVIVENEKLKQSFEKIAQRLAQLYMEQENYQAAYDICGRAAAFFPEERYQRQQISLLIAMDRYRDAYELYKKIILEVGAYLPGLDQMRKDFENLGKAYNYRRDSMGQILWNLRDSSDKDRPYRCLMPAFSDICHMMERVTRLNRYWGTLLCISLVQENPAQPDMEDGNTVMQALDDILYDSLQSLDIYTRYSRKQFLVLLPRENEPEWEMEKRRIVRSFYDRRGTGGYRLEFSEAVVDAEGFEKVEG